MSSNIKLSPLQLAKKCISNISFLKYITDYHNQSYPLELIIDIVKLIWVTTFDPILNEYFCNFKYDKSFYTTLTLGDILNVLSEYGNVRILSGYGWYTFYIDFHKSIRCSNSNVFGVNVNVESVTDSTYSGPLSFEKVNGVYPITSNSIYVSIKLDHLDIIDNHLYTLIAKENVDLLKHYELNGHLLTQYKEFNQNMYTNKFAYICESENIKDVKKQVLLIWLSNLMERIQLWGLHPGYRIICKSMTLDDIMVNHGCSLVY